jgi:hypothetical protein
MDGCWPREQHARREADVRVTDVLRGERQQDAGATAVRALAREEIEKEEERDWLPLVRPTLPALTGQPSSLRNEPATASRKPRSPSGAE